jgi:hypothetical protein
MPAENPTLKDLVFDAFIESRDAIAKQNACEQEVASARRSLQDAEDRLRTAREDANKAAIRMHALYGAQAKGGM